MRTCSRCGQASDTLLRLTHGLASLLVCCECLAPEDIGGVVVVEQDNESDEPTTP